jgi:hypothetical protein
MQIWSLSITFIDKLTVREFQSINRLNQQLIDNEIDSTTLSNELCKIMIKEINWITDKWDILNFILDMESLDDYAKLNNEIAKKINESVNWIKKKN